MLLAQIDALSAQINTLTGRIEDLIAELPEAAAVDPGGGDDTDTAAPGAGDPTPAAPSSGRSRTHRRHAASGGSRH
jgi:hypothetical protein